MKRIEWSDNALIGIKFLDIEHKELLEFYNKINLKHLDESLIHLLKHFKHYLGDEETFLYDISYPHMDTHLEIHAVLLQELETIVTNYLNDKTHSCIVEEIFCLMKKFLFHISEDDKNIKMFCR